CIADLAPRTGLHPNTVRAHLDVLVRSGQVSRRSEMRSTPGRPRELYSATGAPTGDRSYRLLAEVLASRLAELAQDPAAEATEAGRRYARNAPSPAGLLHSPDDPVPSPDRPVPSPDDPVPSSDRPVPSP